MRTLPVRTLAVLAVLTFAAPAFPSYSGKPELPQPTPQGASGSAPGGAPATPREQAELWYRDAYEDVARGSDAAARGDAKGAAKRFRRALERSRSAVGLDSTYSEAWNLVGFTERKLGDYPRSFEAYRVALRQNPRFALAREYYGEGLLETHDIAGARQQLEWLRRIGDAAMLAQLQAAIDQYVAAHPDSLAAHPDSLAAPAGTR